MVLLRFTGNVCDSKKNTEVVRCERFFMQSSSGTPKDIHEGREPSASDFYTRGYAFGSVGGARTKCRGRITLANKTLQTITRLLSSRDRECVLFRLPFCPLNNPRHAYAGGFPGQVAAPAPEMAVGPILADRRCVCSNTDRRLVYPPLDCLGDKV